jgi:hypothetical protein
MLPQLVTGTTLMMVKKEYSFIIISTNAKDMNKIIN